MVFIGLGSNLGNSRATMQAARKTLQELPGYQELACSGCWQSAPLGVENPQPDYYNAVIKAEYKHKPQKLLKHLLEVEQAYGRQRLTAKGARTLDLDLLLFGNQIINEPDLRVPHPRMGQRAFVLLPLLQVADNNMVIPGQHTSIAQLCKKLQAMEQQRIKEVTWATSGAYS